MIIVNPSLVVIWLLSGIAGAVLYGERGFKWGVLGGIAGLVVLIGRVRREQERAQRIAEVTERHRRTQAQRAARERLAKQPLRWTN